MVETIPLGVLVDRKVISRTLAGHVPYENLALYRRGAPCPVCFFSFADLDLPHNAVNAYILDEDGDIDRRRVWLPPVIHYRAIAKGHDKLLAARLARERGDRLFNSPHAAGKLSHCRWLRADPALRSHVPVTRSYDGEVSLMKMLARNRSVVLKRVWGSMGVGILRVRRTLDGYAWERGTGAIHSCQTLTEVADGLSRRVGGRKYIVQRSLNLATYHGNRFDMRCVVQRGATGEWQFVGSLTRVAGDNRIATNVSRGGAALKTMKVLRAVFRRAAPDRMADIESFAVKVAEALAAHEPQLADLGLDLALTRDGRVWFIEANERQMRYGFRISRQWPEYRNSYRLPMEYGYSLLPASPVALAAEQSDAAQPQAAPPEDAQPDAAQPGAAKQPEPSPEA